MSLDPKGSGGTSSLRGWLSDVYFPAILEGALDPLLLRLGARATLDEPMFGRSSGMPYLADHLSELARRLGEAKTTYVRSAFVTGIDRDMTEGVLTFETAATEGGALVSTSLPVAVVAERRRSREVEVRVYCRARKLPRFAAREPPSLPILPAVLPDVVRHMLDAFTRGDAQEAASLFDPESLVREPSGKSHEGRSAIQSGFERLLSGGVDFYPIGSADDGRQCVVEGALLRLGGAHIRPIGSLLVLERGDQGFLRSARIYDDALGED